MQSANGRKEGMAIKGTAFLQASSALSWSLNYVQIKSTIIRFQKTNQYFVYAFSGKRKKSDNLVCV